MADVVQYRLERMVNELDDLERRGLFTRIEIAEIVKQRTKFEYRLKRLSPLKQDYLAYIEYEKQLDLLHLLREKSVAHELKKKGNKKMKKSVSDFAGVSGFWRFIDWLLCGLRAILSSGFSILSFVERKGMGG